MEETSGMLRMNRHPSDSKLSRRHREKTKVRRRIPRRINHHNAISCPMDTLHTIDHLQGEVHTIPNTACTEDQGGLLHPRHRFLRTTMGEAHLITTVGPRLLCITMGCHLCLILGSRMAPLMGITAPLQIWLADLDPHHKRTPPPPAPPPLLPPRRRRLWCASTSR